MQYAILICLVLFAFIKPSSKLAAYLLIVYGTILCAFCSESFDLNNYKLMFVQNAKYGESMAFGWDFLFALAIKSGMSFILFKAVCGFFVLCVVYCVSKKFTINCSLVMALYCICLLPSQITQIRNYVAMAFVLSGVSHLVLDKKACIIKFLIYMFFAISIHYAMVFYLLFILAKCISSDKRFNKTLVVLVIMEIVFLFTNFLHNIFSHFLGMYRITQHIDFRTAILSLDAHSIKTVLLAIGMHLLIFFAFRLTYLYNLKDEKLLGIKWLPKKNSGVLSVDQINIIYRLQLVLMVLLPLYVASFSYIRLFANLIPIFLILIGNTCSIAKSYKQGVCKKNRIRIQYIGIACGVLLFIGYGLVYREWFIPLNSFRFS